MDSRTAMASRSCTASSSSRTCTVVHGAGMRNSVRVGAGRESQETNLMCHFPSPIAHKQNRTVQQAAWGLRRLQYRSSAPQQPPVPPLGQQQPAAPPAPPLAAVRLPGRAGAAVPPHPGQRCEPAVVPPPPAVGSRYSPVQQRFGSDKNAAARMKLIIQKQRPCPRPPPPSWLRTAYSRATWHPPLLPPAPAALLPLLLPPAPLLLLLPLAAAWFPGASASGQPGHREQVGSVPWPHSHMRQGRQLLYVLLVQGNS